MIKPWKRFLILLAVFIGGIILFSKLTNHESREATSDMQGATLPVVYFLGNGQKFNELHAYIDEMDPTSVRDDITPVSEKGILPIEIDDLQGEIKSVSYEVRSLDTSRLVLQSEMDDLKVQEGSATGSLSVKNLLLPGTEYLMRLQVETETGTCMFYTRLIPEGDTHIQECLDFADDFHAITMDKSRQEELEDYLEPMAGVDNENLHQVTINNSKSQACWGNLKVSEVTEPVASIKELNDSYNVILLSYIMSSVDENETTEYYNVEEYYRIRYGTEKMYLLSFERTVEEIFVGTSSDVQGSMVNLGIRNPEVDYKANETGSVVCFVQQGELWSLNTDTNVLTKVFSFRESSRVDARENYNEHNIRIIRADESGSIDFILYGYMNRGDHEGQVGIAVCHYDCLTNTVEEELFIPSGISYQMLKEEMGHTMYISDSGMFYLVIGEQIHQVNLDTAEDEILVSGMTRDNYRSSSNGRYLAWTEGEDPQAATVMHITDFETGETYDVSAGMGERIKPLGFSGPDAVYGLAKEENFTTLSTAFAMDKVVILDSAEKYYEMLKTYEVPGVYVTDAEVTDESINMTRAVYSNGVYVETTPDTIRNRDLQSRAKVTVSDRLNEIKQRTIVLQLPVDMESLPQVREPLMLVRDESPVLELSEAVESSAYYVYAKGRIVLGTDDVAEAVRSADENRGVVIGKNQTYIWKRAKAVSQNLTVIPGVESTAAGKAMGILLNKAGVVADVDQLLAEGKPEFTVLKEAMGQIPVYNVTGCTMDQVLYFVGTGMPVYAHLNGEVVLITGYADKDVFIYHPVDGRTDTVKSDDANEQFMASGNVFYAVGQISQN